MSSHITTASLNGLFTNPYSSVSLVTAGTLANDRLLQAAPHGQESVSSRLIDFVRASSMKHTTDLNINLTVLLKGAKGSGKAALVRQVAQLGGFHLLEVGRYFHIG